MRAPRRAVSPFDRAHDYARQLGDALAAAHDSGVLHGDLKPANIIITEQGFLKLLDFGLARALASDGKKDAVASDIFGTTAFMAPERLGVPLTDPRSEIFSFGVIAYQMLGGEHPFGTGAPDEISTAIRNEIQQPLPSTVPEWLADIVNRCLEKKAEDRYQSMRDVLSAFAERRALSMNPTFDLLGGRARRHRQRPKRFA